MVSGPLLDAEHPHPVPRIVGVALEIPHLRGGIRLSLGGGIKSAADDLLGTRLEVEVGFPETPDKGAPSLHEAGDRPGFAAVGGDVDPRDASVSSRQRPAANRDLAGGDSRLVSG